MQRMCLIVVFSGGVVCKTLLVVINFLLMLIIRWLELKHVHVACSAIVSVIVLVIAEKNEEFSQIFMK